MTRRIVRRELVLTPEEAAELQRRAQAEHRSVASLLRAKALEGWNPEKEVSNESR